MYLRYIVPCNGPFRLRVLRGSVYIRMYSIVYLYGQILYILYGMYMKVYLIPMYIQPTTDSFARQNILLQIPSCSVMVRNSCPRSLFEIASNRDVCLWDARESDDLPEFP